MKETNDSIYFWKVANQFGFLSNFYPCEFESSEYLKEDDGITPIRFCCSEQYFMYRKLMLFDPDNTELKEAIMATKNPVLVKSFGRKIRNFNQRVWDSKKYDIMKNALLLKFSQNKDIREKLLRTGNKRLFEASPYDKIWGIGQSASSAVNSTASELLGLNLLGKALEEVRAELCAD
jgi:ribA/ribD-fused uncharacterized protein